MSQVTSIGVPPVRFRIFLDFWNFQLSLNERMDELGESSADFKIDWTQLPGCLVSAAAQLLAVANPVYEGMTVYTSYDPAKENDKKFKRWVSTWLAKQPGVRVECFERRPKKQEKCQTCGRRLEFCHYDNCRAPVARTVEKGVDTAIAVGLVKLAWDKAYDVAILATADADLIPAVEFLGGKGIKVIQAAFPPKGFDLGNRCWGILDAAKLRGQFRRTLR